MSFAWTLARRDLRGGLGHLRLLAACLFLGVAAIAGIGSLSSAIVSELAAQGRTILGGDIEVTLSQRAATAPERAALDRLGRVSASARLSGMVARADGSDSAIATLKGVDAAYPLYGQLSAAPASGVAPGKVLLAPALAERLHLKVGDAVRIGEARLVVGGIINEEPDGVGDGFGFGPTAILGTGDFAATGLIEPGSLYSWRYRLALPPEANVGALSARLRHAHPDWRVKDSRDGAPNTRRSIEQIGQFLTLVALSALIIAGIGIGNGVSAWLDGKRVAIATLKALGATAGQVFAVYLIQIAVVGVGAIVAALVVGSLVPSAVARLAGDALPIAPQAGVYPAPLLLAAAFGALVTLAFAVGPLDRARTVGAASLFRAGVDPGRRPTPRAVATLLGALVLVALMAVGTARQPMLAAGVLGAAAGLFAALSLVGAGVRGLTARLPRPRQPIPRLALANLHAPGSQTGRLVVALGLGLSLLVTLAVVQTNLSGQLRDSVPQQAPSFFVLDVPADRIGDFREVVSRAAPAAHIDTVPSLRGPVVALNGHRVAEMKSIPEGAWMLRGDRGLTFAAVPPPGSQIVAGSWWPSDYSGPPLVSMDVDAARVLGLRLGDSITVSALGVEVTAKIASLRRINWRTFGFNFVLVFSPDTFAGAPFNDMATISVSPAREPAVSRAIGRAFPSVSVLRVKDVIATVSDLLGRLAAAVAAASSVAVAAGIAVLVGAVVAAQRARIYDAVLLKLLGATRGQVLAVQAIEFALLGIVVAAVALAAGTGAGWYVVTRLFALQWAPDWGAVLLTLAAGIATVMLVGLAGAWPALSARPAAALRAL